MKEDIVNIEPNTIKEEVKIAPEKASRAVKGGGKVSKGIKKIEKIPKNIELRYKSFIKELIEQGFNGTEAYCRAYKTDDREVAKVGASRLLTNINCIKLLEAELIRLNVDSLCSKETIISQIYSTLPNLKSEQVKARYHELLAKIGKLGDSQPVINNFQAFFTPAFEEIVRKRCNNANMTKAEIINTNIKKGDPRDYDCIV